MREYFLLIRNIFVGRRGVIVIFEENIIRFLEEGEKGIKSVGYERMIGL